MILKLEGLVSREFLRCEISKDLPLYRTTAEGKLFLGYLSAAFKPPPPIIRWLRKRPATRESKAKAFLEMGLSDKLGLSVEGDDWSLVELGSLVELDR